MSCRTGYYVAGHDWPAIPCLIPLQDIYRALDGISNEDVAAAMATLAETEVPDEPSR